MNAKEVQSLAEAQQRSMETTAAEMKKMVDLIREFGNDELRLQMEDSRRKVLEGFAVVVESSIPTMKGINFSSSSSSISVYKNLHELGSLLKCEELREATAMMLGALTLAPDMDIFEIEYLKDDLVKAFSSPVFPYLYSEDQFYECLRAAMMSFGEDESGVSEDLKRNLILTLDKNHLSEIKLLEDFIDGYDWKNEVLEKLEKNSNTRKRTFRFSHSITLTRSDLSNERINSLVSSFFERNPHVPCVLDILGKRYKGKTLSIDNFPSTIRHLSFINCEKYSYIGDHFLRNSSLISVDFSGLKNVTTIKNNFLSSCESLEVVVLSDLNNVTTINENFLARCEFLVSVDVSALKSVTSIGSGFLTRCKKLESVDLCSFNEVTVISDDFLSDCTSLEKVSNMSALSNVRSIGGRFFFYWGWMFISELRQLLLGISLVRELSPATLDRLLSYGERLSSIVIASLLQASGTPAHSVDGKDWVVTNDEHGKAQVDWSETQTKLTALSQTWQESSVPIVTGFLGATISGKRTTLGRNGSDYTAALLGQGIGACRVIINTDVPGVFTADPGIVKEAYPVPELSYVEAMELSIYGSRMFHPRTILPFVIRNSDDVTTTLRESR